MKTKEFKPFLPSLLMVDVLIGKGKLLGKGVFAGRDFRRGEVVIRYNLKPLTKKELEHLSLKKKNCASP